VPYVVRQETFKGVNGWWVINPTWGTSRGWFQIRSLRPDYTGPMNAADKLRVASLLGDAEYNAHAAFVISEGGKKWDLWSTFRNKTHEQFLDEDYSLKTGHARADDWDF